MDKKMISQKVKSAVKKMQVFENKIDELETKQTLAQKLKYSVSYIDKLMRNRKIPSLKNGRSVRFILNDVVAALQKGSAV